MSDGVGRMHVPESDDGSARSNYCQNIDVPRDDLAETVALFQAAGFTIVKHPNPAHLGALLPLPDYTTISVRADYDWPCDPELIEWEADARDRADAVLERCAAVRQGIGYTDNT
jgi:hypothetical protein